MACPYYGIMRFLIGAFLLLATNFSSAQAAEFRGRILAPEGMPVAGATVWAGRRGLMAYSTNDGTIKQLTTDKEGAFSFEIADQPQAPVFAFARVQADQFALCDTVLISGENTIQLEAPKGLRGVVQDDKRARIADARLVVSLAVGGKNLNTAAVSDYSAAAIFSRGFWMEALPPVETRSGADGKWKFENINHGIVCLRDPRFGDATGYEMPESFGDKDTVIIRARPRTVLQGRIVTPDGKPLKDVWVKDSSNWIKTPVHTDANGIFRLNSITTGPAYLEAYVPDGQWLAPFLKTPALEAGKVNQAPEWKATRGVLVSGQLVDAKSGAPIGGAQLSYDSLTLQTTNAQGQFRARMLPGNVSFNFVHPDYGGTMITFQGIGQEATFDLGRVTLERLLTLRGRLLDDKGRPVKTESLNVTTDNRVQTVGEAKSKANARSRSLIVIQPGEDGTFEIHLAPGNHTVSMPEVSEWELQPRAEIVIELNEKTAPLELRAKSLATPQLPNQKATGRVLKADGTPLPGVMVTLQVTLPDRKWAGGGFSTPVSEETGQTDAQGRYSIEVTGSAQALKINAVAGDFVLRKAGRAEPSKAPQEKASWNLSDSVAAALVTVSGTVHDINGAPLAKAWVTSPDAVEFAPVQSDEQGHFTLKNVGEGAARLFAAQDRNFAVANAQNGGAELKLMPPSVMSESMRQQFFGILRTNWAGNPDEYWPILGGERMIALGLHMDGALTTGKSDLTDADWSKAGRQTLQMLEYGVTQDPAWMREHGPALLAKIPAKVPPPKEDIAREEVAFKLAKAQVFGNEADRAQAKQWLDSRVQLKDRQGDGKPDDSKWVPISNATRWFRLAGIANALGDPRAETFALNALTFADKAGPKAINDYASQWAEPLGLGGPKLLALLDNEWPLLARSASLAGAAYGVMPFDLNRARAYIETLKKLEADPAYKKSMAEASVTMHEMNKSSNVEYNFLRRQAEVDPAGALETVEAKRNENTNEWAGLDVARSAWRKKDYTLTARAIRPYLNGSNPYVPVAQMARMAESFDKDLAAQLWRKAEEHVKRTEEVNAQNLDRHDDGTIADYAFYRAPLEPALSRLRIEMAWSASRLAFGDDGNREYSNARPKLVGAMMALDQVRALEMMSEITGLKVAEARLRLAAYLLADENGRLFLQSTQ